MGKIVNPGQERIRGVLVAKKPLESDKSLPKRPESRSRFGVRTFFANAFARSGRFRRFRIRSRAGDVFLLCSRPVMARSQSPSSSRRASRVRPGAFRCVLLVCFLAWTGGAAPAAARDPEALRLAREDVANPLWRGWSLSRRKRVATRPGPTAMAMRWRSSVCSAGARSERVTSGPRSRRSNGCAPRRPKRRTSTSTSRSPPSTMVNRIARGPHWLASIPPRRGARPIDSMPVCSRRRPETTRRP